MRYELVGICKRVVEETFTVVVDADNPEEAQDLAYDVIYDWPHPEIEVVSCLVNKRHYNAVDEIKLEFKRDAGIDEDD